MCSVDVALSDSLGVDMRWIYAGSTYVARSYANVPLKTETSLDLANEEFALKMFFPQSVSRHNSELHHEKFTARALFTDEQNDHTLQRQLTGQIAKPITKPHSRSGNVLMCNIFAVSL